MPIAMAARLAGYDIHVATPPGEAAAEITAQGFTHHVLSISRSGRNPAKELVSFMRLRRLLTKIGPDLLHLVTIKPVLYGGLAARGTGVRGVIAAVSGLGTVFTAGDVEHRVVRRLVRILYRLALRGRNVLVICQNRGDEEQLMEMGAVDEGRTRLIPGSGVDLAAFPFSEEPPGRAVVTMTARLLRDKGVEEFVEAARLLKMRGADVEFRLVGSPDPGNPTSIASEQLERWQREASVTVLGYRNDVAEQYSASHVICLPSYGEGLPKSLIEAAACGRPVVTTDTPGCRAAVEPGLTGLLVPVGDTRALADAIQRLLENPTERRLMGRKGRELAEREFAIHKIVAAHLAVYRELEERAGVA